MARVTGIGGVFFRSRDPRALGEWYRKHLGIPFEESGFAQLVWSLDTDPEAQTVWSTFDEETSHLGSPQQRSMINYRVDDLDALLATLSQNGVEIDPDRYDDEHGRFAWIVDCDSNRVELWEPPHRKAASGG